MALGKRENERQEALWVETAKLAAPGHHFYIRLNKVLRETGFDRFLEELFAPYYHERGRKSIPPGVYFRMLMVGYFKGIDSQRGIAWRCADSLSLRQFLWLPLDQPTPDHSSLTRIRDRFPQQVYEQVFQFILQIIGQHGLLSGKTVGVDSITLEANAATTGTLTSPG
ncbi:MAG: transposase [Planctomycetaceae bacterium]